MNVILYSRGCPKCHVLEKKLNIAGIEYTVNDSIDEMRAIGITELPQLSVDGVRYGFIDALRWLDKK